MTHQHIGVDERGQRRRPARSRRLRRSTTSHGVPRLLTGTGTLPANERKSGVLANSARERSTRNSTSSPSWRSSASRTLAGIVTCPVDVTFARTSISRTTAAATETVHQTTVSASSAEPVNQPEQVRNSEQIAWSGRGASAAARHLATDRGSHRRETTRRGLSGYWRAIATRSSSSGSSWWSASAAASPTSISTQFTSPVNAFGVG